MERNLNHAALELSERAHVLRFATASGEELDDERALLLCEAAEIVIQVLGRSYSRVDLSLAITEVQSALARIRDDLGEPE
jgi:hypothetical protein